MEIARRSHRHRNKIHPKNHCIFYDYSESSNLVKGISSLNFFPLLILKFFFLNIVNQRNKENLLWENIKKNVSNSDHGYNIKSHQCLNAFSEKLLLEKKVPKKTWNSLETNTTHYSHWIHWI